MRVRELGNYDVLVVGAGPAGFCAAIASARNGARTALVDKYAMAGGTLTVLGNNSVDAFINPHVSGDRMIIQGIGWEFVRRVWAAGYAEVPDMTEGSARIGHYGVRVNPLAAAKVLDDMLLEAGVSLYYGQPVVDAETGPAGERTRVTGVIVGTKDGPGRLRADFFIDASGDGDLCVWAGNPYELGGEAGELQPGTLRYYLNGSPDSAGEARANALLAAEWDAGRLGEEDLLYHSDFSSILAADGDNRNHVFLNAASSEDRTRAEIGIRKRLLYLSDLLRRAGAGVSIDCVAPETAARESRRILCDGYLTAKDYLGCVQTADAVCHTYWYVDVHGEGDFISRHVHLEGPETPSIPLSVMRPRTLTNVYVAGRCVSGDREAISAVRVKASCMAMGQACGTAAALGVAAGQKETRALDTELLRRTLSRAGAIVPGIDPPGKFELPERIGEPEK